MTSVAKRETKRSEDLFEIYKKNKIFLTKTVIHITNKYMYISSRYILR